VLARGGEPSKQPQTTKDVAERTVEGKEKKSQNEIRSAKSNGDVDSKMVTSNLAVEEGFWGKTKVGCRESTIVKKSLAAAD